MWNGAPETPRNRDNRETAQRACKDKENSQSFTQHSDVVLYDNSNLKQPFGKPLRRLALDDQDPNSQDSGYASSCAGDGSRRRASTLGLMRSPTAGLTNSFKSMSATDDALSEFCNLEELLTEDSKRSLPADFDVLINSPLVHAANKEEILPGHDFPIRPLLKKSKSDQSMLLSPPLNERPFKKPKLKEAVEEALVPDVAEEHVKSALLRASTEPNLIGDFSQPYCLPLVSGRNPDLKSIVPATLAALIEGNYSEVSSFKIIDCRYPYEFEGGHIVGAENLYTKDLLIAKLVTSETVLNPRQQRHILVFHCEFSSNRGPNLYRFLRNFDRNCNKYMYPALYYPEMYLLEGGYKNFFGQYAELCAPRAYVPMNDPQYHTALLHFKEKSKSFCVERAGLNNQNSLRRLSFA